MFLCGIKLKGTKMANKLFIQSIEDFDRSKQSKNLDLQSYKYEHFVFIDDFNKGMKNEAIKDFCNLYRLTSLNKKPTYYKNLANTSCIDLILTNCPKYFYNTTVIETRLSNFHKMKGTIMKTNFHKLEPKIV